MISPPGTVRFGTSSWAYEGWQGLVYRRPYRKSRFSQDTLAEYALYDGQTHGGAPLFQTVGIDHSFYHPANVVQLTHYASQVPDHFRFCSKVWEELTVPSYAKLPRYGSKAGTRNPRFLDAGAFSDLVLEPSKEGLGPKLGPFLFEFQKWGIEPAAFLVSLDRFLGQLPSGFEYAVEVRSPSILGGRYRDVLQAHGVAHVYNHWTTMPHLLDQHTQMGRQFTAEHAVLRLLTPIGLKYETAVERYKPYDRIIEPQPRMRQEAVTLARLGITGNHSVYVLVNNRSEGCSPLTIQAMVEAMNQAAC